MYSSPMSPSLERQVPKFSIPVSNLCKTNYCEALKSGGEYRYYLTSLGQTWPISYHGHHMYRTSIIILHNSSIHCSSPFYQKFCTQFIQRMNALLPVHVPMYRFVTVLSSNSPHLCPEILPSSILYSFPSPSFPILAFKSNCLYIRDWNTFLIF